MNRRELQERLKVRWQNLSQKQKILVILASTGLLAALVYLIPVLAEPKYSPLFNGLDSRDAGAIVEKLQDLNVKYKLADQGQTVLVPADQVYDVRIQLASGGFLQGGGLGFELFDQSKMGVTDFEQQVNYQRALQEELRRTIVQLDEVEQARVHLVLPRESVFIDEQAPASASIALKLKPLTTLKPEQVRGIADLAVGSVEGLKPEDVHIIDMQGRILSDNMTLESNEGNSPGVALQQQKIKRDYEKELEKRIRSMLDRVLGPDKAVAMVTAEMDFNTQEIVSTTYDPGEKVSEQVITEDSEGTGVGGTGGTDAQENVVYPQPGVNSTEISTRSETITNYQVDNTEQRIIQSPGGLKRLSTAVVVDGGLTRARIDQIRGLVSTAIGFDQARGDQIEVTNIAFDNSYQEQIQADMAEAEKLTREEERRRLIIYAVAAGIALLALSVMIAVLMRRLKKSSRRRVRPVVPERPRTVQDMLAEEEKAEIKEVDIKQEQLKKMARENPRDIAEILKVWISDE